MVNVLDEVKITSLGQGERQEIFDAFVRNPELIPINVKVDGKLCRVKVTTVKGSLEIFGIVEAILD